MAEGFAGDKRLFQDRRMWRLMLARMHPDSGGDHELFLFACALMDGFYGVRRARSRFHDAPGQGGSFSDWRGGMSSWATRNREGLRRPASPRRHRNR